jgi:hypothetical protein
MGSNDFNYASKDLSTHNPQFSFRSHFQESSDLTEPAMDELIGSSVAPERVGHLSLVNNAASEIFVGVCRHARNSVSPIQPVALRCIILTHFRSSLSHPL